MTTAERKLRLAQLLLQTEDEATLQVIEETLESQQQQIGQYWAIIDALDWDKEGDDDVVMAPAIQLLSEQEEHVILDFYDWFARQLYRLDGEAYADASVEEGEHFSSDLFLYARCAVLANGRTYYERVKANPADFPKDLFFEFLLRLPDLAYKRKTGTELPRPSKYIYETGFNRDGWGDKAIVL
jgi:hypothetical protein